MHLLSIIQYKSSSHSGQHCSCLWCVFTMLSTCVLLVLSAWCGHLISSSYVSILKCFDPFQVWWWLFELFLRVHYLLFLLAKVSVHVVVLMTVRIHLTSMLMQVSNSLGSIPTSNYLHSFAHWLVESSPAGFIAWVKAYIVSVNSGRKTQVLWDDLLVA